MKKFFIVTVLMIMSLTTLLAKTDSKEEGMEIFEENMETFAERMEDLADNLADKNSEIITIEYTSNSTSKVYLGVFPKDLTLEEVRDLGYDLNYGVLISGIVPGSSASKHKLFVNDIIYQIDDRKIIDDKAFSEVLKSYNPGDVAKMKIFSAGKHIEKTFTFEGRPGSPKVETQNDSKEREVDWNRVALNWIPRYYQFEDIDDINGIVNNMGFETIDDDGLFMNGFGFRVHTGKGFYLGGEWSWYDFSDKINHQVVITSDDNNPENNLTENVIRKLHYENSFGGVTLDKRFYFTKFFQPGIGFLLGAGSNTIRFSQSNGDYDWNDFTTDFDNTANNAMSMEKSFVIFQPRADLYVPILSWVGLRGEVAYTLGYSSRSGWKGEDYGIINSPATKCNGLAFSLGPWIEF